MPKAVTPIRLCRIYDGGATHPPLLGSFSHNHLFYVATADKALEWERLPGETPAAFEDRVVEDLRQLKEAAIGPAEGRDT